MNIQRSSKIQKLFSKTYFVIPRFPHRSSFFDNSRFPATKTVTLINSALLPYMNSYSMQLIAETGVALGLIISHLTLIRDLLFGLTSAHVGKCIFYEAFSRQQPTRNLIIACQKATALKNSFLLVVFWTLVRPIMTKVSIIINYCPFSKFTEAKLVIFHSRNI